MSRVARGSSGQPDAEVLAAAKRVLAAHGYRGLTIERIAEEAGLSRVTLHRRGLSRDLIFNALVAQSIDGYRQAMWNALAAEGTGADRLRTGLEIILQRTESELALMLAVRAQIDALYHAPENASEEPDHEVVDPLVLLVRDAVADGSLRETDPNETALLLTNWSGWTYVHLRTAHHFEPEQARSLVVRRVMEALEP